MNDPTKKYYTDKARAFFDGTVDLNMEDLYQPFLKLIPKGGKILDAGCGSGRDTLNFKRKGYVVVAFDYSAALVKLASDFIGSPVLHMSFKDIDFDEEFDGVWACASLLHVPKREMKTAIDKLTHALKASGILYASFKFGNAEEFRKDRYFSDYNEAGFRDLIKKIPLLTMITHWKTVDVRPNRKDEYWLNVLLRKAP